MTMATTYEEILNLFRENDRQIKESLRSQLQTPPPNPLPINGEGERQLADSQDSLPPRGGGLGGGG